MESDNRTMVDNFEKKLFGFAGWYIDTLGIKYKKWYISNFKLW